MTAITADVAVVGAGASGMAAAVAAARAGAKVVLIERYGFLGGMGTAAAIGAFCGMYSSGEAPQPIATGFGWQVVAELARRGGAYRFAFGRTALVHYDTEVLKRTYDELAAAAGVRVVCHAMVAGAEVRAGRLEQVTATTQGPPLTVRARAWVDASGDAILCYRAGVATDAGDGAVQPATLVFRMANVDLVAARAMTRAEMNQRMRDDAASGAFDLPRTSGGYIPTTHAGEVVINMTRVRVDGVDPEDMARAEAVARRQVVDYARWLAHRVPGFAAAYVSAVGTQIGLRETRRLVGRLRIEAADLRGGRRSELDVGEGAWPFEIHDPVGGGTTLEWLPDDVVYGVPLDATRPRELDNLWVVGRCMSTSRDAHASTRVMGTCFSVGEAIGALAARPDRGELRADQLDATRRWRAEGVGFASAWSGERPP